MQWKRTVQSECRKLVAATRYWAVATTLGLAVVVGAAGAATAATDISLAPAPNQTITVAASATLNDWDVYGRATTAGRDTIVWKNIYQRLYEVNPDASISNQIAAARPAYVNRRTYLIKLKKGIRFSNGKELTSADVAYSINKVIAPETRTALSETLEIRQATAVDKYTIRLSFKTPTALFMTDLLRLNIVPEGFTDWEHPIGSGAYVLQSYTAGQGAVLVYNTKYSGPKPQVTRVNVRFIPDEGTRIQALQSGQIDLAYGLTTDQAKVVPKVAYAAQGGVEAFVRLDTTKPPWNDVRVRQAANYAVDKAKITKVLFGPAAVPSACQLMNTKTNAANPSLKGYPYNPVKARQLLAAAGKTKADLKFILESPSSFFPQDRNVVQTIAQYLNAVGFDTQVNFVPTATFAAHVPVVNHDGVGQDAVFFETGDNNVNMMPIWARIVWSRGFATSYVNPTFDKLYSEALTNLNDKKRQVLTDRLNKMVCDDAPFIFLYDRKGITGMSKRISYTPSYGFDWTLDYDRVRVG
jgi:peptide/nickel transport system substrate-binding protein